MEIGSSARIPALPDPVDSRPRVADRAGIVPTQIVPETRPPDRAAAHPARDGRASGDARDAVELVDVIRRRISVDAHTHRIVYETLDKRTGEVVYQLPDARSLRLYAEHMKASHEEIGPRTLERLA